MSDEKPKPVDDFKAGLGLLFRAAKGAVDRLPTDKIEGVVKDGAKEVGKAFETVANELDKAFTTVGNRVTGSSPPSPQQSSSSHAADAQAHDAAEAEAKKNEAPFDDAYAPEPPKGPRVG